MVASLLPRDTGSFEAGFSILIPQGRELRGSEELSNLPKVTQLAFDHKFVLLQSLLFSPHPATPPSCALNGIVYLQVLCQVVTRQIFIHLEPKQTVILGSIPFCLSGESIRCTHCIDPAYLSRLVLAGMEVAVREKQLRFPFSHLSRWSK